MWIIHEPTREYVYPIDRKRLAVRIKTEREESASYEIHYWNRCKEDYLRSTTAKMECFARDSMYDYYETVIETKDASRYINYYFKVTGSEDTYWLNSHGISKTKAPTDGFFQYLYSNERDIFKVPDWVKGAIFYQIFPERFGNGDRSNDPKQTVKWGSEPTTDNFMGGDLKGITEKLDYLKELGVDALYLNPVFLAPSNHKYDTTDYFHIDPGFGTRDDLKELVHECHTRNMRILLDGVFNHCGYYFRRFQDVLKKGDSSRYKDWFYIDQFPVDVNNLNYETIGYYWVMPKLRHGNPEVRKYFLKVAEYWIKEVGIDGWRLDVADEIDFTFWHELRNKVKSINPECFLLAETWQENRDMLRGDQMDSVMNYPFRDAIVDFFIKCNITSMEFDSRVNRIIGVYPKQVQQCLFNMIGSHDTPRLMTLCGGNVRKVCAVVAFQFCFMGLPVIYYGDEVGMDGEMDPGCRKAMEWRSELQNAQIAEWFKKLIHIRKSSQVLRLGEFRCIYSSQENNVYAFVRKYNTECVYVAINNSERETDVNMPLFEKPEAKNRLKDLISGQEYSIEPLDNNPYTNNDINDYNGIVKLGLKPYQVVILKEFN